MPKKAPGQASREGISMLKLARMFPDEEAARRWFENIVWPQGIRYCPNCGSDNTYECKHAKMPYKCREKQCGKYFSVKTGTVMAGSPIPLLKWLYAIYLDTTSLKGVSSMKLHRDIEVTQKTAWFMQQRIREAWANRPNDKYRGPVEVDETYMGGKRKNMSNAKRRELAGTGRGAAGKTAVVGMKDRQTNLVNAEVVERTDRPTLQGFVVEHTAPDAAIYTDEAAAYEGLPNHESVKHSASQYVKRIKDQNIHTNGIESFWSMLKRAHMGTFHKISPKHMQRYVDEFSGRHNIRLSNTIEQMRYLAGALIGRRLPYAELIADNG